MSSFTDNDLKIDKEFLEACLSMPKRERNEGPIYSIPTSASVTDLSLKRLSLTESGEGMSRADLSRNPARLTDKYPNAYSDFYGSGTPCVYKTGPEWSVRQGPEAQGIVREARPVYRHPIGRRWLDICQSIIRTLDSDDIKWTSINPLAYANAKEARPFCPFILSIGVFPQSLLYDNAVRAANLVKRNLSERGFTEIEVAFVESISTRCVAAGPKLLSFDPSLDHIPDLRKPFTPTLGLALAPLEHPEYQGTGALYFRLRDKDDNVAILTCAHVIRPITLVDNEGVSRRNSSQPPQEVVALGNKGYNNAVRGLMDRISARHSHIEVWRKQLRKWGNPVDGENPRATNSEKRKELLDLMENAKTDIEEANRLHLDVTRLRSIPELRIIGFLLHSEKIASEPAGKYHFTKDWALIQLYKEKIDWANFKGNNIYIGGNLSLADYGNTMFPRPQDRRGYWYPTDNLLQARGVVQEHEFHDTQHLDVHGEKCLLVVKNGAATGTTVGRANGLCSFTRYYGRYGTDTSVEIAVLPYDKTRGMFSDVGDSGSIVLDRGGRIVGILTGGAGPTVTTDITYLTPYWWLERQIKTKFPGCHLYEEV